MEKHSYIIISLVAALSVGILACSSGQEPAPTVPPAIPTSGVTPTANIPPTTMPTAASARPTKTPTLTPTLPPPSATPQPTQIPSTSTPAITPTASPTPTQIPTVAPTPTTAPTLSPTPQTKTSSGLTELQLIEGRDHALALINEARIAEGLQPVTFDDNAAAQSHAEDMRTNCFLSHYGSDGSKPYMRYSTAGGQQDTTSVIHGIGYCPEDAHRYRSDSISSEIDQSMASLLDGGGTTRNILDPHHRKVNIGISFEHPNLWLVLMFVGDYIGYSAEPSIQEGVLRLAGEVKNGARLDTGEFDVVVVYDTLPSPLTRGQIHNAGCFADGLPIAALNPPEPYGSFSMTVTDCESPHNIPVDAPAARSYQDRIPRITVVESERDVSLVNISEWLVDADSFSVEADLTSTIHQYGIGVYTVLLWGEVDGEEALLSEHSIFVTMLPPTPTPTATPTTTPTPTVTPSPTSTPTPTPTTPSGISDNELSAARDYALELINDVRTAAGLNEVTLDTNSAAQSHAEDMRADCFLSHWGSDGLKPYMRYSLSGGQQYSAENVSGIGFCPDDPDRYIAKSITAELDEAMDGLMNSPGHLRNILNPNHRKVNIGISYQQPNLWLVQLFVGDYVEYVLPPKIEDGTLSLSGTAQNGAIVNGDAFGVQIYYDQMPHELTRGQLHNTSCYGSGEKIASLRPPPDPNAYYPTDSYSESGVGCANPYLVPANAQPASSYFDPKTGASLPYLVEVVWLTSTDWLADNGNFSVNADISNLLSRHGDGVYTIVLWGVINGQEIPISDYSIFIPPYSPAP